MLIKELKFMGPGHLNLAIIRVDNMSQNEIDENINWQAKYEGRWEYEYLNTDTREVKL